MTSRSPAERFLKGLQIGDEEGRTAADVTYGGVGYGGAGRPDLSNTHYLMETLEAAGAGPDDPAVKNALIFVSRCQNLGTQHNTTSFAAKDPDGGFYYNPTGEGGSPAGTTPNGGLRSYGSMTYAGLKSMIYAGLAADDPRVKAAVDWAHKHYSITDNPGLGDAGLYYYYQLFAKALDAAKLTKITDTSGTEHDWRAELIAELVKRQQPSGAWTNSNNRWLEGDPNLVTGYALLALSYCDPGRITDSIENLCTPACGVPPPTSHVGLLACAGLSGARPTHDSLTHDEAVSGRQGGLS